MQNYKMILAYDGSRYDGWQKQGNTERTIQGKLETLLSRLNEAPVEVHGSGRTDAGVHAQGQTVSFAMQLEWDSVQLQAVCNQYLPKDIAVLSLEAAPPRFHARLNAKGTVYRYRIGTSAIRNVFARNYLYEYGKPLDVEAMRQAAALLVGTHDFQSFCSAKPGKKSTVRTLHHIAITDTGDEVILEFDGNGFLYHMVRILAGTLIEVGAGSRSPEELPDILAARDRKRAGFLAPAQGLTLVSVRYAEQ